MSALRIGVIVDDPAQVPTLRAVIAAAGQEIGVALDATTTRQVTAPTSLTVLINQEGHRIIVAIRHVKDAAGADARVIVYNLVNLPFAHAYHNYRANICHLTQFVTLFVAMYYRSMMSTTPLEGSAYTYGPVYLEYGCIVISLVVSLVVLAYEIYLFIKNCCCSDKERVKTE